MELRKVDAVGAKPVSVGDGVKGKTEGMVCIITVIAEQKNVFLITLTADDTAPSRFVE